MITLSDVSTEFRSLSPAELRVVIDLVEPEYEKDEAPRNTFERAIVQREAMRHAQAFALLLLAALAAPGGCDWEGVFMRATGWSRDEMLDFMGSR